MNQLFLILCIVSTVVSICFHKKIGWLWTFLLAIALPIVLLVLAIIMLVIGGDK